MNTIKTNTPIDILMYDSALTNEVRDLEKSVVNLNTDYKLQSIGKKIIKLLFKNNIKLF